MKYIKEPKLVMNPLKIYPEFSSTSSVSLSLDTIKSELKITFHYVFASSMVFDVAILYELLWGAVFALKKKLYGN